MSKTWSPRKIAPKKPIQTSPSLPTSSSVDAKLDQLPKKKAKEIASRLPLKTMHHAARLRCNVDEIRDRDVNLTSIAKSLEILAAAARVWVDIQLCASNPRFDAAEYLAEGGKIPTKVQSNIEAMNPLMVKLARGGKG